MNNFDHLVSSIDRLHDSMRQAAVGSVNRMLTFRNWLTGRYIVEYEQKGRDRAEYGANLISRLAQRLRARRGFSERNLELFREFYQIYPQIPQLVTAELPAIGIPEEILQLPTAELQTYKDKDVMNISPKSESDLESALLDHIQSFLLEMGNGFCFEARQKRITLDNEHDRVDLVFYHRILRCHVLIDLKVRKFRHGDAGQMNFYLNYYRENIMASGDNPPVGLILCTDRDKTRVEYATAGMDNQLFVSKYQAVLPSEEEIRTFLENDRDRTEYVIREMGAEYQGKS